ncbi:MAG: DNA-binding protein [Clostridium sp.]|uniref:DNA-binding protein n=1 Tax=Clostridium sp. TaxID=1506 RepID=UPI003D6CE5BB
MNYITAQEIADKWGITRRRVQILCVQNRIEGATRLGNMWVIPKDAEKPKDGRVKSSDWEEDVCGNNE